jgi:gliding motility-associated lipoprotein GldD
MIRLCITVLPLLVLLAGCSKPYVPKPRGYFRIALNPQSYTRYTADCPVSFDISQAAKIQLFQAPVAGDSCRFNIVYPRLKATVYCTYLPVRDNLGALQQAAYEFAMTHEMKASAILRTPIEADARRVFGQLYTLKGDAASQVQFYVTDSLRHFFRGSLYFAVKPNADSLAPVVDHIRNDLIQLTQSLTWQP